MIDSTWGRSLATTAPAGSVGDESFPPAAQQSPGLIPGTLAAYPGCTPRPRNLAEYRAACVVAVGASVIEHRACEIVPGAQVYHGGRFLTVLTTDRGDTGHVELRLEGYGIVAIRLADLDAPVYVLAPAPDAVDAPGAGTPADESTAVRP